MFRRSFSLRFITSGSCFFDNILYQTHGGMRVSFELDKRRENTGPLVHQVEWEGRLRSENIQGQL